MCSDVLIELPSHPHQIQELDDASLDNGGRYERCYIDVMQGFAPFNKEANIKDTYIESTDEKEMYAWEKDFGKGNIHFTIGNKCYAWPVIMNARLACSVKSDLCWLYYNHFG